MSAERPSFVEEIQRLDLTPQSVLVIHLKDVWGMSDGDMRQMLRLKDELAEVLGFSIPMMGINAGASLESLDVTKLLADDGSGIAQIAVERHRQRSTEGWTPEHDAHHTAAELAEAAMAYAMAAAVQIKTGPPPDGVSQMPRPMFWPEGWEWKPSDDPIRNLVKAGALIAAEIDRLQRA